MEKIFSGISLFLLLIQSSSAQCVIQGNLIAYKGDSVFSVGRPINNFFSNTTFHDDNKVIIKDGKFKIDIKCNKAVFTKLNFSGFAADIIVSPGDSIDISVDFSAYELTKKVSYRFSGSNARGNQLFNDYNYNPASKYEKIWSILKESSKDHFIPDIKNEVRNQLKPFDSLFTHKNIDSNFHDLVTSTIKALLLSETIRRITNKNLRNITFSDSERAIMGSRVFKLFSPFQRNLYYGLFSHLYTDNYFAFKRYERLSTKSIYDQSDTCFRFKSGEFTITGPFAYLIPIKDNQLKEYLFGTKILDCLSVGAQDFLKDEIDFFRSCFPNSPYIDYINDFNKQIVENTRSPRLHQSRYFDNWSVKFIDSASGSFHNLDFSSIPELRDKIVFVDIWATWCGPCLKEMEYNYEIDSFLHANNIRRVYISIDQPGQRTNWMKLILKLNLVGYHILAGEELQKNLIEKLNFEGGVFSIPRYLIIRNNNILVADAFRPSNFSSLKDQIQKIGRDSEYK